jgi:hypothetical protein
LQDARATEPAGTIHGFDVNTSVPCRFLRHPGGAVATLDLHETDPPGSPPGDALLEWTPRPPRDFRATLYSDGAGYAFWTDREGWYRVDPVGPSISMTPTDDPIRREERLWGVPTTLAYLGRGDLPLHASAVEVDGRALLFAAPGRHGKTTMAAAFHRAGHRVLAEDLACCRPDPAPAVFPGPAVLRLRPDVDRMLQLPDVEVVAEEPDRVHSAVADHRRGDGAAVPLAGVVFLRSAERVEPKLSERSAGSAIPDLWAFSLNLPDDADRSRCFRGVAGLANRVRLWDLERDMSFDQIDRVVELVVRTCLDG